MIIRNSSPFYFFRKSLERRFKKPIFNTITTYIQRVNIKVANGSLETSRDNVNQLMFGIGYLDEKSFRNTFKKITGISPVQYSNKNRAEKQRL